MKRFFLNSAMLILTTGFWFGCDDAESLEPYRNQVFIKLFGGTGSEEGNDFLQMNDDGFIIVGSTTSYDEGDKDVFIVKTDSVGNKQWTRRYGDQFDNLARSVILSSDNNSIIICGETQRENDRRDILLIELDLNGNLINQQNHGRAEWDEFGVDIIEAISDGYLIVGNNVDLGNNPDSAYIYLLEVDENLQAKPNRDRPLVGDRAFFNEGASAMIYNDLNYLCFGTSQKGGGSAPDGNENFYLFRILEQGNETGSPQFFGSNLREYGTSFTKVSGGYLLAGYQINGNRNIPYVVKVDGNLNFVWERVLDVTYNNASISREPTSVIQTNDGGFLLLMKSLVQPYGSEIGLMKLNFTGDQIEWETSFGSQNNDLTGSVIQLSDDYFILCGSLGFGEENNTEINKMGLIKANPTGELVPL